MLRSTFAGGCGGRVLGVRVFRTPSMGLRLVSHCWKAEPPSSIPMLSTGGDVYSGRTQNAMETAFSRITEQARHQYGCRLKFLTPTPSHKARGGQLLAPHILWVVLAICWPRPESLRFELAVGSVGRPTVFTQPAK